MSRHPERSSESPWATCRLQSRQAKTFRNTRKDSFLYHSNALGILCYISTMESAWLVLINEQMQKGWQL